eukprot:TRINITY_DN70249_c0_g1_i1.p1 TRINITY_DN70249_c0_g1~~TRINITY_DN70249_c0_g1_i1.p1  ORF type:complete len:326 (-),score=65.99 TRINITY_DN70249_c0_g1_i1:136-1113(-)
MALREIDTNAAQHERKPISLLQQISSPRLSLDDFTIGKKLGEGRYGNVFLAQHKTSNLVVAIKRLSKEGIIRDNVAPQIVRELEIQGYLRHPNILRLYGVFSDASYIYLVIDFCIFGELYRMLRKLKTFPEPVAARYIHSMAAALQYLHSKHVMHRDIKPENILIDVFGTLKLADFGWSVHDKTDRRKTMCGTLDYLPVEIVKSQAYTPAVDMWSLGVLAFEFLYGKPPFVANETKATYAKISSVSYEFPSSPAVSDDAKDLIRRLLQQRAEDRLTPDAVMEHPWIVRHMDALRANGELGRPPAVFEMLCFGSVQPPLWVTETKG